MAHLMDSSLAHVSETVKGQRWASRSDRMSAGSSEAV